MVNEGYRSYVFGFFAPHVVTDVFPSLHPDASNYAQFVLNAFRLRALAPPGVVALMVFGGALRLPDAGGAAYGGRPARSARAVLLVDVHSAFGVVSARPPLESLTGGSSVPSPLPPTGGAGAFPTVSQPVGCAGQFLPWFGLHARP